MLGNLFCKSKQSMWLLVNRTVVKRKPTFLLLKNIGQFSTLHEASSSVDLNGATNHSKFASKHFELEDPGVISEFLSRKSLKNKESDTHFIVKSCPFCHSIKGKQDNMNKLYIEKVSGAYFCHRCGGKGSWFHFKSKVGGFSEVTTPLDALTSSPKVNSAKIVKTLDNDKAISFERNLYEDEEFQEVLEYLTTTRGLKKEVLMKYGVGAIEQGFRMENDKFEPLKCVSFPWMLSADDINIMGNVADDNSQKDKNTFEVVRLKVRSIENKSNQRMIPKGGGWGLFGWNTIPSSADSIVLTEGEYDAMAVYQATGLPSISLPNGCQSLPLEVLPLLEKFEKIYLWLDNDIAGQQNVDKFVKKLGMKRCLIVKPESSGSNYAPKDANEALLKGFDVHDCIKNSKRIDHHQICRFDSLRSEIYNELLDPTGSAGAQSTCLPSLNRILKGLRCGELTVLTGPTGSGKTTILSELSLDYCMQGVNTLWGSFEIKNTRLVKKMLTQFAHETSDGKRCLSPETFEDVADEFDLLNMYFLRFFGSSDVDEVIDAMEYAVYAYDVQHIVIDNLQFMMSGQGRGYDKFEKQDQALDKFRRFATREDVHVTLVVHPRKEPEGMDLSLSSVFGTAKATQEADNVIILQKNKDRVSLDVKKNRFDGTLGSIPLQFVPAAGILKESNASPSDQYSSETASISLETQMLLKQNAENLQRVRKESMKSVSLTDSSLLDIENIGEVSTSVTQTDSPLKGTKAEDIKNVVVQTTEPFSKFTQIITS